MGEANNPATGDTPHEQEIHDLYMNEIAEINKRHAAEIAEIKRQAAEALNKRSNPSQGVAAGLEIREGDSADVRKAVEALRVAAEFVSEHRAGRLPEGDARMFTLATRMSRGVAIASAENKGQFSRREAVQGGGGRMRTPEGLADLDQEDDKPHRISPRVPRRHKYKHETDAGRRRAGGSIGKRAQRQQREGGDN